MDDGLITVRVIYMRSGWKSEKIIFTIQCESNKKALKDEIALTIAQMVGLIPGGITIFWKGKSLLSMNENLNVLITKLYHNLLSQISIINTLKWKVRILILVMKLILLCTYYPISF